MEKKKIFQIYIDTESGINAWLRNNPDAEVVDIKFATMPEDEVAMILYKVEVE